MALSIVLKKYKENDNIRVGYKLYQVKHIKHKNDNFQYSNEYQSGGANYGKPLTATTNGWFNGLPSIDKKRKRCLYNVGFHLFKTKSGALRHKATRSCIRRPTLVIVECIAWDIRAEGKQFCQNVFVAKNIQLMREVG
jgi:hypothetical protein